MTAMLWRLIAWLIRAPVVAEDRPASRPDTGYVAMACSQAWRG